MMYSQKVHKKEIVNLEAKSRSVRLRTRLRRQSGNELSVDVHDIDAQPGQSLTPDVRALMERRFGHDFSQVRIHTGEQAALQAHELQANAFTIGQDIFFADGLYQPTTRRGQQLLAHELAHTLQQREELPLAPPSSLVTHQHDVVEREADRAASYVITGLTLPQQSIAHAVPQGTIARQTATVVPPTTTDTTPQQIAEHESEQDSDTLVAALADKLFKVVQDDPDDLSGKVKRLLSRLAPFTHDSVLAQLQTRLTITAWDRLNLALTAPLPSSQESDSDILADFVAPSPTSGVEPTASEQVPQQATEAVQPEEATTQAEETQAVPTSQEVPAEGELVSEVTVEGEVAHELSQAEGETGKEPLPQAEATTALAPDTSVEIPQMGEASPAALSGVEVSTQEESGTGKSESTAEATTEQPAVATGERATEAVGDATEDVAVKDNIDTTEPSAEEAETPEEEKATEPEATSAAVTEPLTATAGEETVAEQEPAEAVTEMAKAYEAEDADAAQVEQQIASEETQAPEETQESVQAPEIAEQQEVTPASTDDQSQEFQEGPATEEMAARQGGAVSESDDSVSVGGGGGGGSPIEEKSAPQVPDVSQAEPEQALAQVGNLPPAQLQTALGGVSAASSRSVERQRAELAANPPQMQTPASVPPGQELQPISTNEAAQPKAPQTKVEPLPKEQAVPKTPPQPLPKEPELPTKGISGPPLGGNPQGQSNAVDAQQLQSSIQELPTRDPALYVTAGETPHLTLEGNTDPARAREQRNQLGQSVAEAHSQGQRDVAQPMGEQHIYPDVPQEMLTAEIPVSSNNAPALPTSGIVPANAPASPAQAPNGTGKDDEAASIIAQEQRGDQIRAAVAQAQGEMNARKQEHIKQVTEAKANAQKDIEKETQDSTKQQADERSQAQEEVHKQRQEWSKAQTDLVEDTNKKADMVTQQGEQEVTKEQQKGEQEASQHIKRGNEEIASARAKAEQEAETKRRQAQEKSSKGVLDWLADHAKAFFNEVKAGIQKTFEQARQAVHDAIERTQKLASEAIDKTRQAVVGAIQKVGNTLLKLNDTLLAGFPSLRDHFHKAIQDKVDSAVKKVNEYADKLKKRCKELLDGLGKALNEGLNWLEQGLLAVTDSAANTVKGAIQFARSAAEAYAGFVVLIKDIAANPGQWLRNLGAAIKDGIRNHLWKAFKAAIKEWFNAKVEALIGVGLTIWNLLKSGGFSLKKIGSMVWEALKAAIPRILIEVLIEQLIALLVPAAALVMKIIEAIKAAWATVQRILQALQKFIAFLKLIKTGQAGPSFADLLAAAAIAVIDFVANWLLSKLRGPASKVADRLKAIAKKIADRLKKVGKAIVKGVKGFFGGVKKGAKSLGKRLVSGAKRVGKAIANSKLGKAFARSKFGQAVIRGYQGAKRKIQQLKKKFQDWREKRKQQKKPKLTPQEKLNKAVAALVPKISALLQKAPPSIVLRGNLFVWKKLYRLSDLYIKKISGDQTAIIAKVNPEEEVGRPYTPYGEHLRDLIHNVVEKIKMRPDFKKMASAMAGMEGTEENPVVVSPGMGLIALSEAQRERPRLSFGKTVSYLMSTTETEKNVKEQQKFTEHLFVMGFEGKGKYQDIGNELLDIMKTTGLNSADLAKEIRTYASRGEYSANMAPHAKELNRVTLLLFGRESARYQANIALAPMMLDLLEKDQMLLSEALASRKQEKRGGGAYPMSMKGAEAASKELEAERKSGRLPGELPAGRSKKAQDLADREIALIERWLQTEMGVESLSFASKEAAMAFVEEKLPFVEKRILQFFGVH